MWQRHQSPFSCAFSPPLFLISATLLSFISFGISTADLPPKTSLLSEGVITEEVPGDALCCSSSSNSNSSSNSSAQCLRSNGSCAVDDDDSTIWTLSHGTTHAALIIQLKSPAIVSDISVTLNVTSVIPTSIILTASNSTPTDSVEWKVFVNRTCQPTDDYLRKRGNDYFECQRWIGETVNASVPDGLLRIQNVSGHWIWWKSFREFRLEIVASDVDYDSSDPSDVIEIAGVSLFGWYEPDDNRCNCHPLGVTDRDGPCIGSSCSCRNATRSQEQCEPQVDSFLPDYGPLSGGTTVFANGSYLVNVTSITVANNTCTIVRSRDHVIEFKSGGGEIDDLGPPSLPVQMSWQTPEVVRALVIADAEFTYKQDPSIERISPLASNQRGGIPQTIYGRNLDSVAYPFITIVVINNNGIPPQYRNYTTNDSLLHSGDEFCRHVNSSILECIAPSTHSIVGSDYAAYLTVSLDIPKYNDYQKCSQEILDGNCSFKVEADPTVVTWSEEETYNYYNGQRKFDIMGSGFCQGVPKKDHVVTVGGIRVDIDCSQYNWISFYPPHPSNFTSVDDAKVVWLTVGYYTVSVGRIRYYVNWIDNPSNRNGLIIGLVCGVGGVTLLVIFLLLFCRAYRRGHRTTSANEYHNDITGTSHAPLPILDYLCQELRLKVERCLVPIERVEIDYRTELGSGNFGKVHPGIFQRTNGEKEPVAVKTLKSGVLVTTEDKVSFLEEATIMADFEHRNVLSLIAVIIDRDIPYVILPLMENGSLRDFVMNTDRVFTVCDLVSYGLQVADGMKYLAANKFIHRDIAARNCMIDGNMVVKVADFGLAKDIFEKDYYRPQNMRPLPIKWMAVECLADHPKYSESSDVWSFGVLMWELMTRGKKPFDGVDPRDLRRLLLEGNRLQQPPHTPPFVCDLMSRCWAENPEDRPKFEDIVLELRKVVTFACCPSSSNADLVSSAPLPTDPPVDYDNDGQDGRKAASYLELMRMSVLSSSQ